MLDVLAPLEIVSDFVVNYDHLRHEDCMYEDLNSWLSNFNPNKKIPISTSSEPRALKGDDGAAHKDQQHVFCVVAETVRVTSVDAIMERLAPPKGEKKSKSSHHPHHHGIVLTKRKKEELNRRPPVAYDVCLDWRITAHKDKPDKWTQVSMALYVSRIRNLESTAVRLAILQNEVKRAKIPALILDAVLDQKMDALNTITSTIMRWVQQTSESAVRNEKETGALTTITQSVMRWLKQPGTVNPRDVISEEAMEAIQSNPSKVKKAQTILQEIETLLLVHNEEESIQGKREGINNNSPAIAEAVDPTLDGSRTSFNDSEKETRLDPPLLEPVDMTIVEKNISAEESSGSETTHRQERGPQGDSLSHGGRETGAKAALNGNDLYNLMEDQSGPSLHVQRETDAAGNINETKGVVSEVEAKPTDISDEDIESFQNSDQRVTSPTLKVRTKADKPPDEGTQHGRKAEDSKEASFADVDSKIEEVVIGDAKRTQSKISKKTGDLQGDSHPEPDDQSASSNIEDNDVSNKVFPSELATELPQEIPNQGGSDKMKSMSTQPTKSEPVNQMAPIQEQRQARFILVVAACSLLLLNFCLCMFPRRRSLPLSSV